MFHRLRTALTVGLLAGAALALTACGEGVVKRVSPPAASVQQLTVGANGNWTLALRLQNFSSMPMTFDSVDLQMQVGEQDAGKVTARPAVSIGGVSADVITVELQPSSAARIVVADALAGNRTLSYSLKGTIAATPQEKKQRSFEIDNRSTLNQAPGLPGVLR